MVKKGMVEGVPDISEKADIALIIGAGCCWRSCLGSPMPCLRAVKRDLSGAFCCISHHSVIGRILLRGARAEVANPNNGAHVSRGVGYVVNYACRHHSSCRMKRWTNYGMPLTGYLFSLKNFSNSPDDLK